MVLSPVARDLRFSRATPPHPLLDAALSADFWRAVSPATALSDVLELGSAPVHAFSSAALAPYRDRMIRQGYFATPPLFELARMERMVSAVHAVRGAGLHEILTLLYDDFWLCLAELSELIAAVMGQDYRVVPLPFVNFVPSGPSHAGFAPHRDRSADVVDSEGVPKAITVWTALTDAGPEQACLFFLPISQDPNFPDNLPRRSLNSVQDIRAAPVGCGSVVCFNQATLHWSARNSEYVNGPRVSFAFELERSDSAVPREPALAPKQTLSFAERLQWIAAISLKLADANVKFSAGFLDLIRGIASASDLRDARRPRARYDSAH
jgi:hypothetical protein